MNTVALKNFALICPLLACSNSAIAEDKNEYTFFNPTPRELMRDLSTDRPDQTESPFTVDAGHFQVEMDLFSYGSDRYTETRGTRSESWSLATANLKLGLCNRSDIQLVVPSYQHVRTRENGSLEEQSGFGDLEVRFKYNFLGNDGGTTAFAVLPFVKVPTNQDDLSNNSLEGGILFPFAVELPAGWGAGLMTGVAFNRDGSGGGYHPEIINSIAIGHSIIGDLSGYVEFFSVVSAESGSNWIGTVDFGLTYAIGKDIQLDAGVNIGVTRAAEDLNPFLGMTWRY